MMPQPVAAAQLRGHMPCYGDAADVLRAVTVHRAQEHQSSTGQEDCIDKETFFKFLGAGQLQRDMAKGWGRVGRLRLLHSCCGLHRLWRCQLLRASSKSRLLLALLLACLHVQLHSHDGPDELVKPTHSQRNVR